MESMRLIGGEEVQRAGSTISGAADEMQRAARNFDGSINRLERLLTQFAGDMASITHRWEELATRFEQATKPLRNF